MKTQITKTEGINLNHNLGGLKITAQVTTGPALQHNLGALKVKAQVAQGPQLQHNLGGLKVQAPHSNDSNRNHAKKVLFGILAAMALLGAILNSAPASAAPEATFVVNTTKTSGFDGICNAAECALAEAINAANANPGKDKINFNIPANTDPGCVAATGICTLTLQSALPMITGPVAVNGYSQPGASPNTLAVGDNAELKIELRGTNKSFDGLVVKGGNTMIKGLSLTGFRKAMILKSGFNIVSGNFLGFNGDGSLGDLTINQIWMEAGKGEPLLEGNRIGGLKPAERNLIGNTDYLPLVVIKNTLATQVKGNYFGTDKTGLRNMGASGTHIVASNSTGLSIGGLKSNEGNVLVGASAYSIRLRDGVWSSEIIRNKIGVGADGTTALGNAGGIGIFDDNVSEPKNVKNIQIITNEIANNEWSGVHIGFIANEFQMNTFPENINISRNQIYNSVRVGIELLPIAGVTPNDPKDVDNGANGRQNFPVLKSVKPSAVGTLISGKLNSTPSKTFRIEFFTNSTCHASGHGEGRKYLGVKVVTTNSNGNANFTFSTSNILLAGTQVTATATDMAGNGTPLNTSEFSKCKAAS